jgi:hypothetical protein
MKTSLSDRNIVYFIVILLLFGFYMGYQDGRMDKNRKIERTEIRS